MPPYISVVIPTFRRLPMLEKVLDSLARQKAAPAFEVVVVDDGSGDRTVERLRARAATTLPFAFRFASQENAGPGRARNRGVIMAEGNYILFIGDDTVPADDFVAEHARVHRESGEDPMLACLGYTGWPAEQRTTRFMHYINDYGLQFGYRLIEHGTDVPFNFFYTSNISLSRTLMMEHPFDTSFPAAAWEDIELAYRLEALGLRIRYNKSAVTRHHHEMNVDSFARRQYSVGKSGAIFNTKHPELGHFLGVEEVRTIPLASARQMAGLRFQAKLGERIPFLSRDSVYEKLMRQHYLRGLRDGLKEAGSLA